MEAAYQRLTEDDGIKIVEVGLLVRKHIIRIADAVRKNFFLLIV